MAKGGQLRKPDLHIAMSFDFDTGQKILIVTGLLGLVLNAVGWGRQWMRERRNAQPITIRLVDHNDPEKCLLTVEHKPKRGQISRAEFQGLLGTYTGGEGYNIAFLKNPRFLERVDDVIEGREDKIDIPVTEKEIVPFRKKQ